MKAILKILSSVLLLLFVFTQCTPDDEIEIDQNKIHVKYIVSYDAGKDLTHASAAFRLNDVNGSVIQLTGHSYVNFNKELLIYRPVLAFYETSFNQLIEEAEFKYVDLDSNIFINKVNLHTIDLPEIIDTIQVGFEYELVFIGDSLQKNEKITAYTFSSLETDIQSFSAKEISAKSIIFSADKTLQLNPGINSIYLKREYKNPVLRANSVGAEIISEYKTAVRQVFVKVY
ncbi:MAG: hypothetical protein GX879_10110 [Bacteroidales bacterium]|nr:hypothetical protein [Bacteroidales bacterium]